ncbi:MAG: DNA replication protein [Alphaproteobacteria bacterium]|nr:DNA replication protein [Alphaproteobacteria bacterium]
MMSDREIQREARRIFRKLMGERCALMRTASGRYLLHRDGKPDRSKQGLCAQAFVAAFRTRDWLRPLGTDPESFGLSEAGAAWLRRSEADGDPFRAQHQLRRFHRVLEADGSEGMAIVNDAESPLARLHARRFIDAAQLAAGETLRRDYTIAQLAPRLAVDLSALTGSGRRSAAQHKLMTDTVLAAKQRFQAAMKEVGPGLNDLLFDVCCALLGLEEAERQFGWPVRSARVVLTIALDRLALHYGLIVRAPDRGRMRGWKME